VNKIKRVKRSAILLDCTRHSGRVQQMTVILRYVDTETWCVEEHFGGFVAAEKTTACANSDVKKY
jgi:hypothetical protein